MALICQIYTCLAIDSSVLKREKAVLFNQLSFFLAQRSVIFKPKIAFDNLIFGNAKNEKSFHFLYDPFDFTELELN